MRCCSSCCFPLAPMAPIRSDEWGGQRGQEGQEGQEGLEGQEGDKEIRRASACARGGVGPAATGRKLTAMKLKRFALVLALVGLASVVPARAQGKLNVVTSTEDLAAIAREIGGDRISLDFIARGYQDP